MSLGRSVGDSEREGVGSIESVGSNLSEGLGQDDWTHANTLCVCMCVLCVYVCMCVCACVYV